MRVHLKNLFIPHHHNNHRAKVLHHSSLAKLVIGVLILQVGFGVITKIKPGVLGFASSITQQGIVDLTNKEREKVGLKDVKFSETLSKSARLKAEDMFANDYWAHNSPTGVTPWDFFKKVNYTYLYAGENLARNFGNNQDVIKAWMNSKTHRENILSPRYSELGVAVVNGVLNGEKTTLVVQHFGYPVSDIGRVPDQQETNATQSEIAQNYVQQEIPATPLPVQDSYSEQTAKKHLTLSDFDITKSVNLALLFIVFVTLIIDTYIMSKKKVIRRVGKNWAHLSILALVIIMIIITISGRII